MAKDNGFTLIECLVALFIVAVVLASATRAIGTIISDVHDSFLREAATWVADNEYNNYLINAQYPDVGTVNKKIMSAVAILPRSSLSCFPSALKAPSEHFDLA